MSQAEAVPCRCPVRPYGPSLASGSAWETARLREWQAQHGHHPYAKARDELAAALQSAESSVMIGEQRNSGQTVLDMVADVFGLLRGTLGGVALTQRAQEKIAPDDFPTPFVSKPTLAQFVKGARVEYEGKPGEVLTGWVEQFGNLAVGYRTSANQELPKAPGAMVSVNQPGSMMMTFLAPTYVPLEKVLRVTCAPDPSPEECWKCHQSGVEWKGGEYPCAVCGRPTVHDPAEASCGHCGAFTGSPAEVDAHAKICLARDGV